MDKKGLVIAQIRVTAMVESVFEIDSLQMYVHECVCVCVFGFRGRKKFNKSKAI